MTGRRASSDDRPGSDTVSVERHDRVLLVQLTRPDVRNAVDPATARRLASALVAFDRDESLDVAVLAGTGGTFCAGADLRAVGDGRFDPPVVPDPPIAAHDQRAPMGPSYLRLSKPTIAAIGGHAVAGGLELALCATCASSSRTPSWACSAAAGVCR